MMLPYELTPERLAPVLSLLLKEITQPNDWRFDQLGLIQVLRARLDEYSSSHHEITETDVSRFSKLAEGWVRANLPDLRGEFVKIVGEGCDPFDPDPEIVADRLIEAVKRIHHL